MNNVKRKKPKRRGIVLLGIILSVVLVIALAAGIYVYRCLNYWQADYRRTINAGFVERQVTLADGSVINYAEGPDNGNRALLLIHGQTGVWQSYTRVLPELSENWHVFAVDCYGHGGSSHNADKYYLNEIGDDLIWFIGNVIGKETVVSGHSSGGLIAAYIAAYGGDLIVGAVLEDPPVFSTEQGYFENTFAYHDMYKPMFEYIHSEQTEVWEAFYLRNCLWGRLYMPGAMNGLANYAQWYHERNPDEPVQFFFMPESINYMFLSIRQYDFLFGERFYDFTWHGGIAHEDLMRDISVPVIFLHIEEGFTDDGILMAAASNEQAQRAVELIGDAELIRLTGNHSIHRFNSRAFIEAVNQFHDADA